jgi:sRNA-binding carbon storage regulator CsrA
MKLTRRTGEKIFIGDYTLKILSIGTRFARISIVKTKEPQSFSFETTVNCGDKFVFEAISIGIAEIHPKKVMVLVNAPLEIPIIRTELIGRPPKSTNPVLRAAIVGSQANFPGIH